MQASLSLAMGSRNHPAGGGDAARPSHRSDDASRGHGDDGDGRHASAANGRHARDNDRDRDRSGRPPVPRDWPANSRDRERGGRPRSGRGGDGRDFDRGRGRGGGGGWPGAHDRAPPASRVFGRSAADVFGKSSAAPAAAPVDDFDDDAEAGLSFGAVKIGRRR